MNQNYINHIALVLDASGSMNHLSSEIVKVADAQIKYLAQRSKELDQETRVTVYTFDSRVSCLIYDKDVLRMPAIKGLYRTGGSTALIDATMQALDDLSKTPELYGDHAFLSYVLTDGAENVSRKRPDELKKKLQGLKDNWTVACFVPDQDGKFEAKKFGFPADNIAIWDALSTKGMSEVGEIIRSTTDNFMSSRSKGVRGYKNLFNLSDVDISKQVVAAKLPRLHPGQYRLLDVDDVEPIATLVERATKRAYKTGEAFYQLSKPEKVQSQKAIALMEKKGKGVYVGPDARQLLGLPAFEVKVAPANFPDFEIFIQSTSVNRKLVPGTKLLLIS